MTIIDNAASFLRATVSSIHTRWISNHNELRFVSEPSARQMRVDELRSVYQEAHSTYLQYGEQLHHQDKQLLENILKRPFDDYVILSKGDNVVPLF